MEVPETILFAGGGTGGHLFPGIALAEQLRLRHPALRQIFFGSHRSVESTIVAGQNIEHRMLSVEPLSTLKRNPWRFVWRNWRAWRTARTLLKELNPSAVIGLGGYTSAPLVYAASRQRVPIILLEQNVIPGKTTRALSRYATNVCISFAETEKHLPHARRVTVTGNPVRSEIAHLLDRGAASIGEESSPPELLILGGSQGAESLNAVVLKTLASLRGSMSNWKIVHQTGPRDVELARQVYSEHGLNGVVSSFFHEIPDLYRRASLVLSRSGATTLAELACAGAAMILLPYPYSADAHQLANANAFVNRGAAILVEHARSHAETALHLAEQLQLLLNDPERRKQMGTAARSLANPGAAERIADVIEAEMRSRST